MTGLAIAAPLDESFYTGAASTTVAPEPYPAALNGRGYMLDFSTDLGRRLAIQHASIQMLRSQADTSNQPAEHSLNPEGLWRRTQNSWHKGAGQSALDRESDTEEGSDPARFRTSKGAYVWDKWRLGLLPDTEQVLASANTNLYSETVGDYEYVTDGTAVKHSTDLSSWTTVTSMGGVAPTSITTDGYNVYVCQVAAGMYTTTRGAASGSQLVSTALAADSVVGYVKGRLLVSKANAIYNITSTSVAALPSALFTQANTDFKWVGFAEGPGNAYAAGYSGDKSLIYRLPLKADGSGLDAPIVAGELPDGEVVKRIRGYLGFLEIGTSLGVRIAEVDRSSGEIYLGDLIETGSEVSCFEPQGRFVWYGLTNYDGTSTGLGRMDLRTFNGSTPAYASDLMVTGQGAVTTISTFLNKRVFGVSGLGFYAETAARVAEATIDGGAYTYGLIDQKVNVFVAVSTIPLVGSVQVWQSQDEADFQLLGTLSGQGATYDQYPTNQSLSDQFETRLVLARFDSDDEVGPQVTRYTAKANPAAATGYFLTVPIRLHEDLVIGGVEEPCVPSTELSILDDLRLSRRVVLYQEGGQSYTVTVEAIEWFPDSMGRRNQELNGLCVLTLKTLV